ncbi:glycosyltransferase family A protein [Halomonas sp. M1]|uniref:glycosyltransferase family A protein n=1 Tax=Halomonas sp. M1 TaxID=3035470 RepID=UPI00248561A7|nr:glycosyltransferase family A protein [Halomonas sp. M1]WFE72047.1 glycosyltransferase family A protein [Halomonas sp. M1]
MPFFSVIIPVNNKVATLASSLEYLYRQTFRDFEVIAVDDRSTDGSLDVLRQYEKAGLLRLFQLGPTAGGGYAARNLGADKSVGQWLVFFDADGIMLLDHLSCFANDIAHNPDIELFINAYQKIQGQRRLSYLKAIPKDRLSRFEALSAFARFDFIHINGVCISRERFFALGCFPKGYYRRSGDVYFWLKVLCELNSVHYNATVTSLWILKHEDLVHDKRHFSNCPTGLDFLKECDSKLTSSERRQFHQAINRKVISRAVQKKKLDQSVCLDLKALTLTGMNVRLWLHVVSLLVPQPYYNKLRSHVR